MTTLGAGLATIAGALMQGAAMAYREVSRVEIAEVVRRWQSGNSQRQIANGTGLSRATVRRYIVAAMGAGLTRDGSSCERRSAESSVWAEPEQSSEG